MMTKQEKINTAKMLPFLFNAFPQSAVVDVDFQIDAFMLVLEDFEFQDVEAAIKRIMSGGEGHEGRTFCPSTAELCAEVRKRAQIRDMMAKRELKLVKSE